MRGMGKNPFEAFDQKQNTDPVLTPEDVATIRAAQSDVDEFTAMTFKIRKTYLKKLRDYAYTNRLEIKEALDQILAEFMSQIDDSKLLEYPEQRTKSRQRRAKS